jgi:glutamyl-tRNA synthetase
MKRQRDIGEESPYRQATIEENLKRFDLKLRGLHDEPVAKEESKKAAGDKKKEEGKKEEKKEEKPVVGDWCIRAKMNMQDKVKCLRDPVFYRVKNVPHHRTGTKYKAYPTYDFACPIVDSIEEVTHCLRTIEYHDRNALYHWLQKHLGLREVIIYDYSRLNLVSTILSKRSLKWFVDSGIADGWMDPRFPTVQGIMRRGMTVEALKIFMLDQGPSKATNLMEWDKLWAINKGIIDPVAPRYTAIVKETACKLIIENAPDAVEAQSHPLHPKDATIGSKAVVFAKELLIEKDDAVAINEGEKITLMKWGNVTISKKEEINGVITLTGKVDPEDKDFKGTKKLTWIANDPDTTVEIVLVELDHLITKKKVEENDNVQDLVNHNSKIEYIALGEGSMRNLQKGIHIQIERRGYFYVDEIALGDRKIRLNFVPDGKTKSMSAITHKIDASVTVKG